MWDPCASVCPVLGSHVCTTTHSGRWTGVLWPRLGFPFGVGEVPEWEAGCCYHHGCDHLNCPFSLWVYPLVPPSPDTEWSLSWLYFVPSGLWAFLTHAGCMCFSHRHCSWLRSPPPPCFCSGWCHGCYSGKLTLPACAGQVDLLALEFGYLVCRLLGCAELTAEGPVPAALPLSSVPDMYPSSSVWVRV